MIIEKRKTYCSIVKRALKKCTRMYKDGVHCYCTPSEYVALCLYFGHPEDTIKQYYIDQIKVGEMRATCHYFRVPDGIEEFQWNRWSIPYGKIETWSS